jgi:pyruvate kinase
MINLLNKPKSAKRQTKIIATIGPATSSESVLKKMILEGMNIARFNFSHGTKEEFAAWAKTIRSLSKKLKKEVLILQDLQGPRIRVGKLQHEGHHIDSGHDITLNFGDEMHRNDIQIKTDLEVNFKKDDTILIDSGLIELKVKKIEGKRIICKVIVGGALHSGKGLNFPDTPTVESFTQKDAEDLAFGQEIGVDLIGLSFVEDAKDVNAIREKISPKTRIVSKIERPQAIHNFNQILEASDAIMVARGDLGVEIPIEKLPFLQKRIIRRCRTAHKFVIVATDMMASMVSSPRPTRAEVLDIANAVLDGADAVMLSNETAVGKYPLQTLATMRKIVEETENFKSSQELSSLL